MYLNLSAVNKLHRNTQISVDLGTTAYLMVYGGTRPLSPDNTVPSGNLLCAMACANPFGTLAYQVQNASVNNAGTGGSNGTGTVTGTTGTGTLFQATVTIAAGSITGVTGITLAGSYTVLPTSLSAEPVTGAGLAGATLSLAMTSVITASAIAQGTAIATGTAVFVRLAANNTAGGVGVVDLDVATSGASVTINTINVVSGGPVVVTAVNISEA